MSEIGLALPPLGRTSPPIYDRSETIRESVET
jgi:hypothetical protein